MPTATGQRQPTTQSKYSSFRHHNTSRGYSRSPTLSPSTSPDYVISLADSLPTPNSFGSCFTPSINQLRPMGLFPVGLHSTAHSRFANFSPLVICQKYWMNRAFAKRVPFGTAIRQSDIIVKNRSIKYDKSKYFGETGENANTGSFIGH